MDWPSTIPYQPEYDGYRVERRRSATITTMEDGPNVSRRWGTADWTKIFYKMIFSHGEYETFDNFVKVNLNGTQIRFNMPVGRLGTPLPWVPKVVYLENGVFNGPEPHGITHVSVTFSLMVRGW